MEYYIKKNDVVSLLMKEAKSHELSFSAEAYERAANIVACMPNEDAQPVKRGEWIYNDKPIFGNPYGRYCCSLCGSAMDSGEDNYCPCCGANMKGDVEIARIDK